jgi:hypothetical protein
MAKTKRRAKSSPRKIAWTGNRPPMKHSDFFIGREFLCGDGRYRCTDIGTRTIAAIRLDLDHDPRWYNGPPYAVVESVFDEYDFEGCEAAPKRRSFDDSGRSEIVTVPRESRASS